MAADSPAWDPETIFAGSRIPVLPEQSHRPVRFAILVANPIRNGSTSPETTSVASESVMPAPETAATTATTETTAATAATATTAATSASTSASAIAIDETGTRRREPLNALLQEFLDKEGRIVLETNNIRVDVSKIKKSAIKPRKNKTVPYILIAMAYVLLGVSAYMLFSKPSDKNASLAPQNASVITTPAETAETTTKGLTSEKRVEYSWAFIIIFLIIIVLAIL